MANSVFFGHQNEMALAPVGERGPSSGFGPSHLRQLRRRLAAIEDHGLARIQLHPSAFKEGRELIRSGLHRCSAVGKEREVVDIAQVVRMQALGADMIQPIEIENCGELACLIARGNAAPIHHVNDGWDLTQSAPYPSLTRRAAQEGMMDTLGDAKENTSGQARPLGADELRWASEHNTQIVRALEQKAQIYLGLILVFLPLASGQHNLLPESGPILIGLWTLFGMAALLNMRVVLPTKSPIVADIGETAIFLRRPKAIKRAEFERQIEVSDARTVLVRELHKIQIIRADKEERLGHAHWGTLAAVFGLVLIALLSRPEWTSILQWIRANTLLTSLLG